MSKEFDRLVDIVKRLRAPDGCPWDRKQTLYSLKQNVIEEVFELIDALDRKDIDNIKEELGDMLLHVVFHALIAEEDGLFSLDDVVKGISDKLIRRHPHVFGDVKVNGVDDVLKNWEEIKKTEKKHQDKHYLDSVPKSLPPIERAYKIQKKASRVGFDWDSADSCFEKVEEEFKELKDSVSKKDKEKIEEEVGDLFFSLINFSRLSKIDASEALRKASLKFEKRFNCIEDFVKKENLTLEDVSLDRMDKLWDKCKNRV